MPSTTATPTRRFPAARLAAVLALACVTAPGAKGQYTWTNTTSGTQQWNTAGNWSPGGGPPNGAGVTANLSVDLGADQTVNLASGVTLGSLTFGDSTSTFFKQNIQGSAITFNNGGSGATLTQANTSSITQTISNNIVLNDNLTIVNNGNTAGGNNAMTLSGVVSGSGGIILNAGGGGSVYLNNGGNTYSGGVTFNHSSTSVVVGTVAAAFGTGAITFNGAGTVNTSTPGGGAYLLTTSNTNVWNSGFNLNGFWNTNGNVTLGANVTVTRANAQHLGIGGNIGETGGSRSLTFSGGNASNTTVLNGTNTYTGGTTVSTGSVAFLKTASMPSTGNVSFATGTTLGIGLGGDGWTSTGTGAGTLAGIFQGTNAGVGAGSATLSYTNAVGLNLIVTGNHSFGVIENLGSGATAFTKSGLGTLTMTGDNTYTGGTTVTGGGNLILDYGSSNTSKFASAAALTLGGANSSTGILGGGAVTLKGGSFTEVVSATSLNAGHTTIARDGGTSLLRLNAITRASNGTISFADTAIAQTDTNNFGASGANGILGGWATIGDNWAVSANTGAADTAITALGSYTTFTNTGGSATTNYLLAGTDTLTGATAVGTLKISATSGSLTLGANSLTVTSTSATSLGGIMYAGGSGGTYSIEGGGAGRIAASTASNELIFAVTSGTLTVNALISGNSGITKSGAGTLVLGGTNTTSGAIHVNQGVLRLNNAAASGAGSPFNLLNNFVHAGAALELTGGFSFTADDRFYFSGTGISNGGALRSVSGANTWQGLIETGLGDTRINNDSSGLFTINRGIIIGVGGHLIFGGTGNTTVTAPSSGTITNQAITGGGDLTKDGAGTLTLTGPTNYVGATTVNAGTLLVNGTLASGTPSVAVGGSSATGTPTLGGTGTINRSVTIASAGGGAAGTLAPGNSTVGTLNVVGNVTVQSGGKYQWELNYTPPGPLPGSATTITTGQSDSTSGVTRDLLAFTGVGNSLTMDNGSILAINYAGSLDNSKYYSFTVATSSGTPSIGSVTFDTTGSTAFTDYVTAGGLLTLSSSGGNVYLNAAPVPEPATVLGLAALGLGAVGGVRRWRGRKDPTGSRT